MGRGWMTGAMLAIAALPVSAPAQVDVFADCAADRADAGLKRSLAAALINGADDSVVDPLMAQYAAISNACTADWKLDDAQRKAYLDYGVMRLMREWLVSELAGYGLSAATVDEALDFGPARGNAPLAGGMREDEVKELVQAFIEAGIDAENLSAPAWEAVGTYAAVSPIFWRKRQQVSAWMLAPKHAASPPVPVAAPIAAPIAASVAPAVEPPPVAPDPASLSDTAPVEGVLSEPVPVAADTSAMPAEPPSAPISDPVVEPVAAPVEAAAPVEEPTPSAPDIASPAVVTPPPEVSAPTPAEAVTPEARAPAMPDSPPSPEPTPEAPVPAMPDTPAPFEPVPDAAPVEPSVAPAPVSAVEAAPAEAAIAPAAPAAPVILPYEPLPDAVDPVLPGGEVPAPTETPPAEPPPGV